MPRVIPMTIAALEVVVAMVTVWIANTLVLWTIHPILSPFDGVLSRTAPC